MPRYFFHVERPGGLQRDTLGRVLDDDDAARAHATAVLETVEREAAGPVTVYARREDGGVVGAKLTIRAG